MSDLDDSDIPSISASRSTASSTTDQNISDSEDGILEVLLCRSPCEDSAAQSVASLPTPPGKEHHDFPDSFNVSLPIRQANEKSPSSPVSSEDQELIASKVEPSSAPAASAAQNMAFAFDIDGVLVRGERLIPEGRRALQILNGDNSLGAKIPHIFLTNGGGKLEADRCAQLTKTLDTGIPICVHQLVQSHTPMQELKEHHSTVLIVGGEGDRCKTIAQSYGFTDVVVPYDIVAWDASIAPFKKLAPDEVAAANPRDFSRININAILVFSSSRDYATDLQIIMDLLRSSHGRLGTVATDLIAERIPIYFSQGDLVWPTEHFQPRMSQGTFRIALEAMYKAITGIELDRFIYGKPERATYAYADEVLAYWVHDLHGEGRKIPANVYMVGDNPASDVCGGNNHGWQTCLVRTGIFQGGEGENDESHPASFGVFDDVLEAVMAAMRKELGAEIQFG